MLETCMNPADLMKTQVYFTLDEGRKGMNEILDGGFVPDGVICATDTLAVGAMKALQERGFIIGRQRNAVRPSRMTRITARISGRAKKKRLSK